MSDQLMTEHGASAATHYLTSKGDLEEIAKMAHRRAVNARNKLVCDQIGDARQDEIDGLTAHIDALDAKYAAEREALDAAA